VIRRYTRLQRSTVLTQHVARRAVQGLAVGEPLLQHRFVEVFRNIARRFDEYAPDCHQRRMRTRKTARWQLCIASSATRSPNLFCMLKYLRAPRPSN
jgi:hypothetical protein